MQQYRVGQILFLIADASKVVPIQVVEEVVRTTLDGKEKTYIVKFPDKKETTADIKKVKGNLFKSKDEVKKYMIDNATSAIEQMVSLAEDMSINVFNNPKNYIIFTMFNITFGGLSRLIARDIIFLKVKERRQLKKNIVLYGAGEAGAQLLASINMNTKYNIFFKLYKNY